MGLSLSSKRFGSVLIITFLNRFFHVLMYHYNECGGDLFPFSHFGILIPTIKHFTNVRDFMNWGVFG